MPSLMILAESVLRYLAENR